MRATSISLEESTAYNFFIGEEPKLTLGAVLFSLHEGSPAPVMAPVPRTTTSAEGAATTKGLFDHFDNSMMGRTQERSRILNWTNLEYQPYDLSELEEPFDWRSWD